MHPILSPLLLPRVIGYGDPSRGGGGSINLTGNLMAYWDMEANGNDSGPRGNNQTGFGTPTFVAGGKPNNCTNLVAASSQYFEMANNGDIVLSATNFTLAAWANLATTGGLRRIFGKGNISTPATFEYALYFNNGAPGRFAFSVGDGVAATTVTDTAVSVSTGTWYFVVAQYNAAAQQISISVNGNTPVTTAFTGTVLSGGNTLRLGNDPAGATRNWNGQLDSLGIWKRFLSFAEVTALYNSGNGRNFSQL